MDKFLDGLGSNWKTAAGGIALLLIGVAGLILGFVNPEHEQALSIQAAISLIAAGLAALGIGHKVERQRKEFKAFAEEVTGGQEEEQQEDKS